MSFATAPWPRVAVYPAGTNLDAAVVAEQVKQAAQGFVIELASVTLLDSYYLPTTAEERQDMVAVYGAVCFSYEVTPL